jgi:hypothetical protein
MAEAGYAVDPKTWRVSQVPNAEKIEAKVLAAHAGFGQPREGSAEWQAAEAKRMLEVFKRPDMRGRTAPAPEDLSKHPARPDAPRPEPVNWFDRYTSGDYSGK